MHILLWDADAPKVGLNTEKEITEYIDRHVSGRLPDKEKLPELYDLVAHLQTHSHRDKCQTRNVKRKFSQAEKDTLTEEEKDQKIKDAKCRYGFAKPVAEKTSLSIAAAIQRSIDCLEEVCQEEKKTTEAQMKEQGKSQQEIKEALEKLDEALAFGRRKILETNSVDVILQRGPDDVYINPHNLAIIWCWKANMDLQVFQFCLAHIHF